MTYLDLVAPASCDAWGGHHSPAGSVCSQHPDVAPALVSVLDVPFYCFVASSFLVDLLRLLPLGVPPKGLVCQAVGGLGRRATWPNHFRRLLQMMVDTGGWSDFCLDFLICDEVTPFMPSILRRHLDSKASSCFSWAAFKLHDSHPYNRVGSTFVL